MKSCFLIRLAIFVLSLFVCLMAPNTKAEPPETITHIESSQGKAKIDAILALITDQNISPETGIYYALEGLSQLQTTPSEDVQNAAYNDIRLTLTHFLAQTYLNTAQLDSARIYALQAIEITHSYENKVTKLNAYLILAEVDIRQRKIEQSNTYLKQVIEQATEMSCGIRTYAQEL